ncbi:hypothetical protein ACFCVY_01815 [Streptomyces sp. NPDC056411]
MIRQAFLTLPSAAADALKAAAAADGPKAAADFLAALAAATDGARS